MGTELIGVTLGGTTTSVVRGFDDGTIVQRRSFATSVALGAAAVYEDVVTAARALKTPATVAVGVAVGGPIHTEEGLLIAPPHLPFRNFPLAARLSEDLDLPVHVQHDATACALAEWRWGPDSGATGLAYLTCGTGFGVGLVLNGQPRYGTGGLAPEIGHVRYRADGPDAFGKRGSFEGYASATALTLLARRRNPQRFAASSPMDIAALAADGDPEAIAIVHENARAVGAACALLADLLALNVIVLGSLARYLEEFWMADVRREFEHEALPHNVDHCQIRKAVPHVQELSGLAAAIGGTPKEA